MSWENHQSWNEAKKRLKFIREENLRSSKEVIDIWDFYSELIYNLGDDLWVTLEQVCFAACDCGRQEVAAKCVRKLNEKFPGSLRVKKLRGLIYESHTAYSEAEKLYKSIIREDETNSSAHKRLIAVLKAQNKIQEAIMETNSYLKIFMSDYEAWMELCELYLMEMEYDQAAYCMEEVLMSNPHNHLYHQKYAEIKYTVGDISEARSYFAQAAKLCPNNLRALYGLLLCSNSLASQKGKGKMEKNEKIENKKYMAWAIEQINNKYQEFGSQEIDNLFVESMFNNLQSTQTLTKES